MTIPAMAPNQFEFETPAVNQTDSSYGHYWEQFEEVSSSDIVRKWAASECALSGAVISVCWNSHLPVLMMLCFCFCLSAAPLLLGSVVACWCCSIDLPPLLAFFNTTTLHTCWSSGVCVCSVRLVASDHRWGAWYRVQSIIQESRDHGPAAATDEGEEGESLPYWYGCVCECFRLGAYLSLTGMAVSVNASD